MIQRIFLSSFSEIKSIWKIELLVIVSVFYVFVYVYDDGNVSYDAVGSFILRSYLRFANSMNYENRRSFITKRMLFLCTRLLNGMQTFSDSTKKGTAVVSEQK